jgi:hypothetical protein
MAGEPLLLVKGLLLDSADRFWVLEIFDYEYCHHIARAAVDGACYKISASSSSRRRSRWTTLRPQSAKQKHVEDISKRINLGLERQDIDCDVLLNTPEKGRKSFVAVATSQIVNVEDMTSADYQSRLFDPDERPDSPDKGPGSRPQLPPEISCS